MSTARHTRAIQFDTRAGAIADGDPIPCTIATTNPVERFGVLEVLDCSPAGVDLSRAPLPLITVHDANSLAIGIVENLQAQGDRVTGLARFGTSPEAQQIRADVLADIHRSLSVGYALLDEGTPIEGGCIYRWQPYEVSLVPIPADPAAGFFRSLSGVPPMTTKTTPAEAQQITALCTRHGVPDFAPGLLSRGVTLAQAGTAILDELAHRDQQAGGHRNVLGMTQRPDQNEREAIENTLVARMGGRVSGPVIGAADCTALAARALALSGQRVQDGDSRDRILKRALHTTGDFPLLLGNAVNRVLHAAYEDAPATLKTIGRLANLPDFRGKSVVRLGGAPSLEKVSEAGEFSYGTVNETANGWRLATFGRIVGLSRQALVNDDLSGFATMLTKFGQAAARREAEELVSVLLTPPQIDGAALFAAGRSTQITNVLNIDGLAAAVRAMRAQKDLDGGLVMQEPATLLVPAALEMTARQLVASFNPTSAGAVQPFTLSVAVEPRLDAASAAAWYLVAGNQSALEYGYLDGAQGVQTDQRDGFEIDGIEIKARLDFGCGWVSPVGWVKSTGTP
ncbi:MAG: hypothetical protein Q7U52_19125 [Hydrogenophaga sp.]|uniref:phage major capsid protein n=1 Tax=Hydrogenophaga sp. TaxID=1904254 RepID=UPI00271A45E8|nr:hypothetical protein [Hydrogenophaga sp.]MDO9149738.1 hypothetical protein [Hydrogenophaga sp.]MDO9606143.1 hypothetical protein [Hydrogenophaga sp.]